MSVSESGLVEMIRWAGSARKLLELHTADGCGRCPVCSAGGTGSGKVRAPCNLWLAARAALQPPDQAPVKG